MHVLFVTGEYPPMQGGVGAYTRELGRALQRQNARVTVLTSQRAAQPNCAEYDNCIRVLPAIERWDWHLFKTVPALATEMSVDWVHVQYQTAAFDMHPAINFAPATWRRKGVHTAWTYHDLLPMYLFPKAGRLRHWVTERPAQAADLVITTTQADRTRLVEHGVDALSIPIGSNITGSILSPDERRARRRWRGYADGELVIAYFGFLNQSKGGLALIRTLKRLVKDRPHTRLLMIGEQFGASDPTNHDYYQKVESEIRKSKLEQYVQWTGSEPDREVAADLNACDVLLLPFTDGASLRRGTLMAGLANGCAIVTTTPQTPLPELVDEEDLLFATPNDVDALAAAVIRIADDATLAARLRTNARQRSELFSWDQIARTHLELYGRHPR